MLWQFDSCSYCWFSLTHLFAIGIHTTSFRAMRKLIPSCFVPGHNPLSKQHSLFITSQLRHLTTQSHLQRWTKRKYYRKWVIKWVSGWSKEGNIEGAFLLRALMCRILSYMHVVRACRGSFACSTVHAYFEFCIASPPHKSCHRAFREMFNDSQTPVQALHQ